MRRFRLIIIILGILCLAVAVVAVGLVEGETMPSSLMTPIVIIYCAGLLLWLYLTLTARTWAGRLGGFFIIAVGSVILYCYLRANL